jgi:hypothetical protein
MLHAIAWGAMLAAKASRAPEIEIVVILRRILSCPFLV